MKPITENSFSKSHRTVDAWFYLKNETGEKKGKKKENSQNGEDVKNKIKCFYTYCFYLWKQFLLCLHVVSVCLCVSDLQNDKKRNGESDGVVKLHFFSFRCGMYSAVRRFHSSVKTFIYSINHKNWKKGCVKFSWNLLTYENVPMKAV